MGWIRKILGKPDETGEKPKKLRKKQSEPQKGFATREEREAIDIAEEIYQEPSSFKEETVFETVKKGKGITTKQETQIIGKGGNATAVTTTTIPVAACGRRINSEADIAGFCSVCGEAVCQEHAQYCKGYGSSLCQKLLCPKHVLHFTDEDGESQPCCIDHYNMRVYYRENIPEPRQKKKTGKEGKEEKDEQSEK